MTHNIGLFGSSIDSERENVGPPRKEKIDCKEMERETAVRWVTITTKVVVVGPQLRGPDEDPNKAIPTCSNETRGFCLYFS